MGAGLIIPQAAVAAPAEIPGALSFVTPGAFSGTVPNGACAVRATVLGGGGGSAMTTTSVSPAGGGASVSATYGVLPGQSFSGLVGGGGQAPGTNVEPGGAGGIGGGGAGGSSGAVSGTRHPGAGGGGYSQLTLGASLAVLAGGGGGSAGGHSETSEGVGGNAGLPTAAGAAAGSDGTVGRDFPTSTVVTGGGGGGTSAGGAAGTNSELAAANGTAGSSLQGGAGGPDTNPDAAGGGGGGYFGGGGGASTVAYNTQFTGATQISGSGGGGGSSYVAPTIVLGEGTAAAENVTSSVGTRIAAGARGNGAAGSVSLSWIPCDYDLAVSKSVSSATAPIGSTVTWTISVENLGADDMTQGDTVTITDSLPGIGGTTITGISVAGPASSYFASAALTCNAQIGDALPGTLECARPYQVTGESVAGVRGLNAGETLTVTYTQEITDAAGTTLSNTATVTDRITGDSNDSAIASTTVIAPPTATDDSDLGNTIGDTVAVDVLGNDSGTIIPGSVTLVDADGDPITSPYVVPGEGTWTVSGGTITFVPEVGFLTDPTPVTYRITDSNGLTDTATVTITYLPQAAPDSDLGNAIGTIVDVPVLANDTGDFDLTTLAILDGVTPVSSLVVPGEGTWSVQPDGVIRFTPETGFLVDPTPITYQVADTTGDVVTSTVTVGYVPTAVDDSRHGNPLGSVVVVDVLANDEGDFDPTTVVITDPATGAPVTTLTVAGQGTWTVDPTTGAITFTPLAGYVGNPTPIQYTVTDTTGDSVTARVTVTYLPVAANDVSTGNRGGSPVTVDVIGNDSGIFDPASVRLIDPGTGELRTSLVVANQGTWTVNTTTGAITFTPFAGFRGNPTPVEYQVTDVLGNTTTALVTITYVYPAAVTPPTSALAVTGAEIELSLIGTGALLLLGGLAMLLIARRHRVES